jgi:nicotinate phosphoribosyltransferase
VARADGAGTLRPVAKRSVGKPTIGGRTWALRRFGPAGVAAAEVVSTSVPVPPRRPGAPGPGGGRPDAGHRVLLRQLVRNGEIIGAEPLATARERHRQALGELPREALRLSFGDPAIPTVIAPASAR